MRVRARGLVALMAGSVLALGAAAPQAVAGTRGLEVAVPAYVYPSDPMMTSLQSAAPAASIVVLNPNNGDNPFDASWQARADALRARTTATGSHTKVLGYVHTEWATRDPDLVKKSIDNYLKTTDGKLHVDGIFFDTVSRDCGPNNSARDWYLGMRQYVQETVSAIDPSAQELVVDNPGTAIADCFLEPGHRTADTFVTFENTYAQYTGGGWLGGNVFNSTAGYYSGASFDPSGTAFWHLVHGVPGTTEMRTALDTAFARGAGYVYATDDQLPNPWDQAPSWGFSPETSYAAQIG